MLLVAALLAAQAGGEPPQPLVGGSWITDEDYPVEEKRLGHAGTVDWALQIDVSGKPSDCSVKQSSGYPGLDRATCGIVLRRLRFMPARDGHGKATVGSFEGRFTWQLPGGPQMAAEKTAWSMKAITKPQTWLTPYDFASFSRWGHPGVLVAFEMKVAPTGRVSGCTVTASSGSQAADRLACSLLTHRARFEPARDGEGQPATVRYSSRFGWGDRGPIAAKKRAAEPHMLELTVAALPKDYRQPVEADLVFDKDHHVKDCRILQSSGSAAVDGVACGQLRTLVGTREAKTATSVAGAETYIVSFRTDAPAKP
jgi:TonB family protein